MKRIGVLFPGIGYTVDKPLLYYSGKLMKMLDYEVKPVTYTGFPDGVKGNSQKMEMAAYMALEQAEIILSDVEWAKYDDILFISKSVGTVVGSAYAKRHGIRCRHILFTPVEMTFQSADHNSIAFHGTADPWADTNVIRTECCRLGIPLYETDGGNHSLETGDVDADIGTMQKTIRIVRSFVKNGTV